MWDGSWARKLLLVAVAAPSSWTTTSEPKLREGLVLAMGKTVFGRVSLAPGEARVVTKFCFDYSPTCEAHVCPPHQLPGYMTFEFSDAKPPDPAPGLNGTEAYIALLDDEYQSFPEVSQVWGELSCREVLQHSKRSFRIDWRAATAAHAVQESTLIERLRPRWWHFAIVSCAPHAVELSYKMHLRNLMQGWEQELSMDTIGLGPATATFGAVFGGLLAVQLATASKWRELHRKSHWLQLHPALLLLTGSAGLAACGEACWLLYYLRYAVDGEGLALWSFCGHLSLVTSRMLLSLLLLLMAQGACVCAPDIAWSANRELVAGLLLCSALRLLVELWGESELRSMVVEYAYDTGPGILLVSFDLFLLWLYLSRSWSTFSAETRLKPRLFFKTYTPLFALWFASLPMVAVLAYVLAPQVRFRITTLINSAVHVLVLGTLVHTFRPAVAAKLYELRADELAAFGARRGELEELA